MKTNRSILAILLTTALTLGAATSLAQEAGSPGTPPTVPVESPTEPEVEKPPISKPKTADELRKRITFLLSGYEFFPSRDDLDRAGEPAAVIAVLTDIVEDPDASVMHRFRAVDALGFYEEKEASEFLARLVQGVEKAGVEASARHASLMRHHAITALARSQRDQAVDELEPFLVGDDLQLTLTAVVALGKHGKEAGRERLRALVASEPHRLVKREAKKFLR